MHKERIRRHGYPELKRERGEHGLEKLLHKFVDDYIVTHLKDTDNTIAGKLRTLNYTGATRWTVGHRRRKLGKRKYLLGEIKKHKAWIRACAMKEYGSACELCDYRESVDTHHIIPKHQGGQHGVSNLMIVCPNCHALITRKKLSIRSRQDIPQARKTVLQLIRLIYK